MSTSTVNSGGLENQNSTNGSDINGTEVYESSTNRTVLPSIQCSSCDTQCMYHAIETCFTLGIIANAIVLLRVRRDKQLWNPTFVSIAACALADMCFLMINLSNSFEFLILYFTCQSFDMVRYVIFLIFKSVAWFSANAHVALLAILRYVWLTFPLKANVYLSMRRVVLLSVFVWVLGLLIMTILTILIFFTDFSAGRGSQEFNLVFWTATYLMPLVTTVTLHVVKMYKVKKMTNDTATDRTKKVLRTMSRMVILVVFLATILPFLYILDRCLNSFVDDVYGSKSLQTHINGVANLLVLLNHSINPILYAFLSEPFRMSLKRMVGINRNAADEDNTVTGMTALSEVQKREIILRRMDA